MRIFPIAVVILAASHSAAHAQARSAVILDFNAALTDEQRQMLQRDGFLVGAFLGEGNYQASIPAGQTARMSELLRGIAGDARLIEPTTADKLGSGGSSLSSTAVDSDGRIAVLVTPAGGTDDTSVQESLAEFGPLSKNPRNPGWIVRITPGQVEALARKPVVQRLEAAPSFPAL